MQNDSNYKTIVNTLYFMRRIILIIKNETFYLSFHHFTVYLNAAFNLKRKCVSEEKKKN